MEIPLRQYRRQLVHRIVESIHPQLEHLEVRGDAELCAQIQVRLHGLGRAHVDTGGKRGRFLNSFWPEWRNRKQRDPNG